MTDTEQLEQEISRLQGKIDGLENEIKVLRETLDDAESAYEKLFEDSEKIEILTANYIENKQFYDDAALNIGTIKEFVFYVKDECKIEPENEHVYRAYSTQAFDVLKKFEAWS